MDAQNFSYATLEYLEAYGNRLRWNLAFTVPINALAGLIILKYSTPAMGMYKYFILTTIISAFVMDFHSSFIYGFHDFVPTTISCPTGITKNLGHFWGTTVNYTLIHFTMSFCGLSLTYSIIYQYFSLTGDPETFRKPKTIIACFMSVILYPMPAVILFILSLDHQEATKDVFKNYPDIAKIFIAGSCSSHVSTTKVLIYFSVATLQIFVLFTFAVTVGTVLALKLDKLKHSLSSNTLKAHKQYMYALYIQGTVPFFFIVTPVIFMIFSVSGKVTNIQDAFEWAMQCFSLHSCVNAITVLYIIKPYRNALIQWIQKIVGIFYKRKIVDNQLFRSSVSSSVTPTRSS